MSNEQELIPVGKITATHGIKGQLKVYSYSGNIDSVRSAATVILKKDDGMGHTCTVRKVAAHASGFILTLDSFDTIDQVQPLVGSELCLLQSQLPQLADDEYYWRDLLGLRVVTDTAVELGPVVDIFEAGSCDVYVVQGESKEYLIPAIASVISKIDIPGGQIIITPLDGLLDL